MRLFVCILPVSSLLVIFHPNSSQIYSSLPLPSMSMIPALKWRLWKTIHSMEPGRDLKCLNWLGVLHKRVQRMFFLQSSILNFVSAFPNFTLLLKHARLLSAQRLYDWFQCFCKANYKCVFFCLSVCFLTLVCALQPFPVRQKDVSLFWFMCMPLANVAKYALFINV